ncbi:putative ATP dependent RNA helicase [Polychaeton citri CBS 116435]|uniref:ATP-dependent RNA helicase n=1 Tax=Polychaeton citri CBS 116435 TaxID=1314669 RepID=A0A9P4UQZ4_9PEZI|nr:putative ATP dependent RNA helicase [Polychaeton citri CBS 116435]
MADDGLLLNFELPPDAYQAPRKFKGGSWKDRLTARKSQEYGRRKASERKEGTRTPNYGDVVSEDEVTQPRAKRAKISSEEDLPARKEVSHSAPKRTGTARETQRLPKLTNGEVISSLFTYNPSSGAATDPQKVTTEDDAPVEPTNAPLDDPALASFTEIGLSPSIANHLLRKLGIKAPTAIQRKTIEQLCREDTDAFVQAQTGSGKTLAYLLPIVQRITDISRQMKAAGQDFTRDSGLFAIVLAPTRELSKQIETVLEGLLSCCHWIVGGIVIGGEKKKSEKARLRKGLNILVATPGRLADHVNNTEVLDISRVRWLVLDEGDRLMELGFEQDIQKIVSNLNLRSRKTMDAPIPGLPATRSTVLCSATIKSDVEKLRGIALKNAVSISIDAKDSLGADTAHEELVFSAPAQLRQSYAIVPAKQRLVTLVAVLKQAFRRKGSVMKCVVFMSCADVVDFHFDILSSQETSRDRPQADSTDDSLRPTKLSRTDKIPQGQTISEARTQAPANAIMSKENRVEMFRLHGSLQQATRTSTLKAFTKCLEPSIMICTDVAARGLDLPNVDFVIEYDPPFSKEDHLHRIGRTARAGKDGRAMIFLQPGSEEGYVEILKEGRPRNLTSHNAEELLRKAFAAGANGATEGKSWEDAATDLQLEVERWALESPKHLEQARRAYQSHIRAYATHVAAERGIFDMKQLHLGHLAKAFALRDKPGSIRVPGLRPDANDGKKTKDARKAKAGMSAAAASGGNNKRHSSGNDNDFDTGAVDERANRRKMMNMTKGLGGASEFNLG